MKFGDFIISPQYIRDAIELERANYLNRTIALNKVSEPKVKYKCGPKK